MFGEAIRVGDWVEVLPIQDILRTLDGEGTLDAMPFMPEMARYAGRRFRVMKSAHKTCDPTGAWELRRLRDAVHLETRCDGGAHDGCEARCLIIWKTAWLQHVDGPHGEAVAQDLAQDPGQAAAYLPKLQTLTRRADQNGKPRYRCQVTEIAPATTEIPAWDLRHFVEDVSAGNISPRDLLTEVGALARTALTKGASKLQSRLPEDGRRGLAGRRTPELERLDLQPDERVRVKIAARRGPGHASIRTTSIAASPWRTENAPPLQQDLSRRRTNPAHDRREDQPHDQVRHPMHGARRRVLQWPRQSRRVFCRARRSISGARARASTSRKTPTNVRPSPCRQPAKRPRRRACLPISRLWTPPSPSSMLQRQLPAERRQRRGIGRHRPDHRPLRPEVRGALEIGQHHADIGPVRSAAFQQRREVGAAAAGKIDIAESNRPGLNCSTRRTRSSPITSSRPASCRRLIAAISLEKLLQQFVVDRAGDIDNHGKARLGPVRGKPRLERQPPAAAAALVGDVGPRRPRPRQGRASAKDPAPVVSATPVARACGCAGDRRGGRATSRTRRPRHGRAAAARSIRGPAPSPAPATFSAFGSGARSETVPAPNPRVCAPRAARPRAAFGCKGSPAFRGALRLCDRDSSPRAPAVPPCPACRFPSSSRSVRSSRVRYSRSTSHSSKAVSAS